MRTVWLVDQHAAVGRAVEWRILPPGRRQRLIIAEHALPGGARMRRLDQGVSKVAKQPLVVGELELRWTQADARGRLGADPAVHVVVEDILAGAAEIAAAAAPEDHTYHERRESRRRDRNPQFCPDRKTRLRHGEAS